MHTNKKCIFFVLSNIHYYEINDVPRKRPDRSCPVNVLDLRVPGYLGKFKRSLKLKYQQLLQQASEPPEFLVIDPSIPQQTAQVKNNN